MVKGFWPCPTFTVKKDAPADTVANFMNLAYKHGISLYNVLYIKYSHKDSDIEATLPGISLSRPE